MIELTLGQLRAPAFGQICNKLLTTKGFEPKTFTEVATLISHLDRELQIANKELQGITGKYAAESGDVPADKMAEWQKDFMEFSDKKIQVKCPRLRLKDILKAELTPADYLALQPMLLPELEVVQD